MYGFNGIIRFSNEETSGRKEIEILKSMKSSMVNNGSSESTFWHSEDFKVNFDNALDQLYSTRYSASYYGNISNINQIKEEILSLENHTVIKGFDENILLAAFEAWGIEETVLKLKGGFVIALYDNYKNTIHLIRDRVGIKSLYYGWVADNLIFSTELKTFKQHPLFEKEIDRNVLSLYLKHNYVPAPYAIYKKTFKLMPGTILSMDIRTKKLEENRYWNYGIPTNKNVSYDSKSNIQKLDELLNSSIEQNLSNGGMQGAFLSGGVDSSTVSAIMQSNSMDPVNTFSIGFEENEFNEAKYAKEVAEYIGSNHTELYLTSKQAIDIIPKIPFYYDEPFADSSQIPTLMVSNLAKKEVSVVLSGDGGDELFAGYKRYKVMNDMVNKFGKVPFSINHELGKIIGKFEKSSFSELINSRLPNLSDKLYRIGELLQIEQKEKLYDSFTTSNLEGLLINENPKKLPRFIDSEKSIEYFASHNFIEWMSFIDLNMYLPDDILVKVDRASMANNLDTRSPILDYDIVDFAMKIPIEDKIRKDEQKWILKQVMYKYLPASLMDRPKKGFGAPIASWLRGPLNDWVESLLEEEKLKEQGFFNMKKIRAMWLDHKSGRRNWHSQLWTILMFQEWLENE